MQEAVIVATARSPIGRAFKGSFVHVRPDDLAAAVVRAALEKIPSLDPLEIDDVLLGCGQPAGTSGFNLGRVVAVLLGLDSIPGVTVNRYCASSLQTTRMAFHAIRAGEGDVFISAGVETVSQFDKGSADSLPNTKNPLFAAAESMTAMYAAENGEWVNPRERGLLPNIYTAMGQTAENLAKIKGISRTDQDAYAVSSQSRAEIAVKSGFWARDLVPITLGDGTVVSRDDCPRAGVTLDGLSQLKPAFRTTGTVTAGNCCPLNDGAAALVIMSAGKAAELGLTPLARILATGVSGISPELMGYGPVEATRQALGHAGMTISDIDLFEINEAFAAQVIPSARDLGIDFDKLNVNGGAIALGHPFGMTGARITSTLINALQERDEQFGLETMCVGGGQGMAMIIERLS